MNATHLTYAEAVAAANKRKAAVQDLRSPSHVLIRENAIAMREAPEVRERLRAN